MGDSHDRSSRSGAGPGATGGVVQRAPGKRSLVEARYPAQRRRDPQAAEEADGAEVAGVVQRQAGEAAGGGGGGGAGSGLPAHVKAGAESLSGMPMDDVKVHYNSDKPAGMGALAYAQGTDIHLGPGQEHHLGHEAWHTVQQKQGRVAATEQFAGVAGNADPALEHEADVMGDKIMGGGAGGAAAAGGGGGGGAGGAAAGRGAGGAAAAGGGGGASGGGAAAATGGGGGAGGAAAAGGGGGAEGADELVGTPRTAGAMTPEPAVQLKASSGAGVVQRIKYKSADVDVDTLTADQCAEHLKRFYRKKANKPTGDDGDYEYASDDDKKIKKRQAELKEADILKRHGDLVVALGNALGTLATVADFTSQPPWNGHNPGQGSVDEQFKSGGMTADETTVVNAWRAFLGSGPYTTKHPRTGGTETGRVMSHDGLRSIRYGDHEKTSKPNQHHYHEETWKWDQGGNVINVENRVQRVPVT
ncbi:MAG TPA: DUF4157 domain-containing protein [Kofleriaceae bacterium]|nr:DUF4157 domain-containing protein [Kofleriaceae bacterium]